MNLKEISDYATGSIFVLFWEHTCFIATHTLAVQLIMEACVSQIK
jgi:hypothetical protein